jgi:hypothetical protein
MKIRSALKRSIVGAWVAAVLSLIALAIAVRWPNAFSFTFLGFSVLALIGDVVNIICIGRKAARDPGSLQDDID